MKWFNAGTKKMSVSTFGSFIKLMKLPCTAAWVSPQDRVASGLPTAAPETAPPHPRDGSANAAAWRRHGTAASRPLAAARHCRPLTATCCTTGVAARTLLRGGGRPRDGSADAAAGLLRGTLESRPPAAPRNCWPLTTTCRTGLRRGRSCWADLLARLRRPDSAPAPRRRAVLPLQWATSTRHPCRAAPAVSAGLLIKSHQDSRPRLCSDWDYMVAGQDDLSSEFEHASGTEDAISTQLTSRFERGFEFESGSGTHEEVCFQF